MSVSLSADGYTLAVGAWRAWQCRSAGYATQAEEAMELKRVGDEADLYETIVNDLTELSQRDITHDDRVPGH